MNKLVRLCALCVLLCMLFIGFALAASFMKIDGIPGGSIYDAHKGEIDICPGVGEQKRKRLEAVD